MCQCLTVLLTLLISGFGTSLLLVLTSRMVREGDKEALELIIGKHDVSKEEMEEAERQFKQLAGIVALITAHLSSIAYLLVCAAQIPFPLPFPSFLWVISLIALGLALILYIHLRKRF